MTVNKCVVCNERPMRSAAVVSSKLCAVCSSHCDLSPLTTIEWAATRARRYERARQKRSGR